MTRKSSLYFNIRAKKSCSNIDDKEPLESHYVRHKAEKIYADKEDTENQVTAEAADASVA
jgi:isocitrate/isopropylmalate dehydrogenase